MARPAAVSSPDTRQQILQAALRQFANCGYAGASVQAIVDEAGVTKPVLYYHFGNKEGLYRALVDWAAEKRLQRARAAAATGTTLADKFNKIVASTFEFVKENRELTRLSFSTLFAGKGELPNRNHCVCKGRQVFDMMAELADSARRAGDLKRDFTAKELTTGIYGMMNFHVMMHLVVPEEMPLNRALAGRIVNLFLSGGAPEGVTRLRGGRKK